MMKQYRVIGFVFIIALVMVASRIFFLDAVFEFGLEWEPLKEEAYTRGKRTELEDKKNEFDQKLKNAHQQHNDLAVVDARLGLAQISYDLFTVDIAQNQQQLEMARKVGAPTGFFAKKITELEEKRKQQENTIKGLKEDLKIKLSQIKEKPVQRLSENAQSIFKKLEVANRPQDALSDLLKQYSYEEQMALLDEILPHVPLEDPNLISVIEIRKEQIAKLKPIEPINDLDKQLALIPKPVADLIDAAQEGEDQAEKQLAAMEPQTMAGFLQERAWQFWQDAQAKVMFSLPEWLDPVFQIVREQVFKGQQNFKDIGKLGKRLLKVPKYTNAIITASGMLEGALNRALPVMGAILKRIPFAQGQELYKVMQDVLGATKLVSEYGEQIQSGAKIVKQAGEVLIKIGTGGDAFLKNISATIGELAQKEEPEQQIQEAKKIESILVTVENRIKAEREKIIENKSTSFKQVFLDPILDFGKRVSAWFKELIESSSTRMARAQNNYAFARKEYLRTLGFNQEQIDTQAIQDRIQNLQKSGTDAQKENIAYAVTMLARAASEIVAIQQEFATKVDSMFANYDFLLNGWDNVMALPEEKKEDAAAIINSIFTLHDLRRAQIAAFKEGVTLLKEDLALLKNNQFSPITDNFLDALDRLTQSSFNEALYKHQAEIETITKGIKQNRDTLQKFLKEASSESIPGDA